MSRNNIDIKTSFGLFLLIVNGVFGVDGDEVKSVSVMEGESVTLHTHLTHIQRNTTILWMFGPKETLIADLYEQNFDINDGRKIFGSWTLWLDNQTGSFTITNVSTSQAGLYKLLITMNGGNRFMQFHVTVNARLPDDLNTNHTQHLNITEDCVSCSDIFSMAISAVIISIVVIVNAVGIFFLYRKCKHASKRVVQKEEDEVLYMDTGFLRQNKQRKASDTRDTIYSTIRH